MKYESFILIILIASTTYVGDAIVFRTRLTNIFLLRAFADNMVHALIGFFSALLFFSYDYNISSEAVALNVGFCTLLSSFIDVDHVIVARSILWKDISNVRQRGIFHCSTVCFLTIFIFLIYSYVYKRFNYIILGYMSLIAFTSHHIRDGNRRGLWLYPFGHSKPINIYMYVLLSCILPIVYFYLYRYTKPTFKYTTIVHEIV